MIHANKTVKKVLGKKIRQIKFSLAGIVNVHYSFPVISETYQMNDKWP